MQFSLLVCGGSISNNTGIITSPQNQTSFFCEWQFPHRWSENQTLTFTVFDSIIGNRTGFCNFKYASVLSISSLGDASDFNANICGNISSITVRCPLSTIRLTVNISFQKEKQYQEYKLGKLIAIKNRAAVQLRGTYSFRPNLDRNLEKTIQYKPKIPFWNLIFAS